MHRFGLLVLLGVALVTACTAGSPGQSVEDSPPVAVSQSAAASVPELTAVPSGRPATILPPASLAGVTVDNLTLVDEPSLSASVVETLRAGDLAYLQGAVEADGLVWYRVLAGFEEWPGYDQVGDDYLSGWVLGGQRGIDNLALEPVNCPVGEPTLATIAALDGWSRVACFGDQELTLTSVVDTPCCQGVSEYAYEPDWLAHWVAGILGRLDQPGPGLPFHIDPASGLLPPERGQVVSMTGHFDDPASATCTWSLDPDTVDSMAAPLVDEAVVVECREQFVVSSYEVVGTESLPPCC